MKYPEDDGLFDELQKQIFFILHKKQRYTLWKNVTRLTLLILSALITIISGWDATQSDKISEAIIGSEFTQDHMVLIMSTMVTLITAVEALFKYTDKSNTYTLMMYEFRSLERRMCYDYEKDPELYLANKDGYFQEYQEILRSQKDLIDDSGSGGS